MTTTQSVSNYSAPTDSSGQTPSFAQALPAGDAPRLQISNVVRAIESPAVREIVGVVFDDLLRLQESLDSIEVHLRKVESAEQTFALFQLIHDDARGLVNFILNEALKSKCLTKELFDTLDGISFAVSHDLQRVFETTPKSSNPHSQSHAIIGRLYRANDVLTNCLQQSTITLAMIFDPELDGATLFNNSDMRFRQSLQLCEGLGQLIQLVIAAEENPNELELASLREGVQEFCDKSMELLMYSDWPQFESVCGQLEANHDPKQLTAVLHQIRCYLETILGQVRMRAVLANVFPLGFGDNQFSAPHAPTAHASSAALDWNNLAIAV